MLKVYLYARRSEVTRSVLGPWYMDRYSLIYRTDQWRI